MFCYKCKKHYFSKVYNLRTRYKTLPFSAKEAMEDQDQDVYGPLEENNNLEEQVKQKPGQILCLN